MHTNSRYLLLAVINNTKISTKCLLTFLLNVFIVEYMAYVYRDLYYVYFMMILDNVRKGQGRGKLSSSVGGGGGASLSVLVYIVYHFGKR